MLSPAWRKVLPLMTVCTEPLLGRELHEQIVGLTFDVIPGDSGLHLAKPDGSATEFAAAGGEIDRVVLQSYGFDWRAVADQRDARCGSGQVKPNRPNHLRRRM